MRISGERYVRWQYQAPLLPDIGWRWERAYNAGISFAEYSKPWVGPNGGCYIGTWTFFGKHRNIYADEQIAFSKIEMRSALTSADRVPRLAELLTADLSADQLESLGLAV